MTDRENIRKRLRVGSVYIDEVTFEEALDAVGEMIAQKRGGRVFTPNIDHVVMAGEDARFRGAYARAELSLVDGMPLLWASRLLGSPLPEKISGSDFTLPLMARAEREGWRVFLLGGAPGIGAKAAERLSQSHPALAIVGVDSPKIDMSQPASSRTDVVSRIRASKADLVLVAFGAPKQELWIDEVAAELAPAVFLGIGATIDFIAGASKRSPTWMSASGLEWLYRLGQEPRRLWRRYLLRDPKFLLILLQEVWAGADGRVVEGGRWRKPQEST